MYTLLRTVRLNGISPQRHLRCVLEHTAPPSERVDELLPLAVAAKWADEATAPQLPMAT